jgi:hypothetical protein
VAVHLNQSGFATNLVESFARQSRGVTPTAMPYQSGVPINSIAPSLDADDFPAQIWHREAYQSLVGSIGWLSCSTRPNIASAHSFLSSYTNKLAPGHMKAALYVLHYVHSGMVQANVGQKRLKRNILRRFFDPVITRVN